MPKSRKAPARWSLQDAKNKLSAVVDAAVEGAPQIVTRRGVETAVVISYEEYERMTSRPRASFVEHLLSIPTAEEGEEDIDRIILVPREVDL
jgi:antitoxin Phd